MFRRRSSAVMRAVSLTVGFALALVCARAEAGPPPRVVVRFPERAKTSEVERLLSSFRAQLRDIAWVDAEAPRGAESAVCIVVVELSGAGEGEGADARGLVLRFMGGRGDDVGEVRVLRANTPEVLATEAGAIVRAVVVARMESKSRADPEIAERDEGSIPERAGHPSADPVSPRPAGAQPEPVAAEEVRAAPAPHTDAPEHSAASTPSGQRAPVVRIGAFYTGMAYAPELSWLSGVRGEAIVSIGKFVYLGAGYEMNPGAEVATANTAIRVSRQAGDAFVGLEKREGHFGYGVDGGVALARTVRSTVSIPDGFVAGADASLGSVEGTLRVRGLFRIPGLDRLHLDAAMGVQICPRAQAFVVRNASGAQTSVLSPRVIHPAIAVGLGFDAW